MHICTEVDLVEKEFKSCEVKRVTFSNEFARDTEGLTQRGFTLLTGLEKCQYYRFLSADKNEKYHKIGTIAKMAKGLGKDENFFWKYISLAHREHEFKPYKIPEHKAYWLIFTLYRDKDMDWCTDYLTALFGTAWQK